MKKYDVIFSDLDGTLINTISEIILILVLIVLQMP